jgi:hypothetical protein
MWGNLPLPARDAKAKHGRGAVLLAHLAGSRTGRADRPLRASRLNP